MGERVTTGLRRVRRAQLLAGALALGVIAAGLGLGAAARVRPATPTGSVTWADPPGGVGPLYIFPLTPSATYGNVEVFDFQYLMWRPLYWFGQNGTPLVNQRLSVGELPVYSNGGRTVTITLKPYRWSDGLPVTSRDVEFWINLLRAEKSNYAGYVPGLFPDNLVAERYTSPSTFSLTFTKAYNHDWLLYNELSLIIPIPQQTWDRTRAGGAIGNYDQTTSGAEAVYRFLNAQSDHLPGWDTNPIWQVVDGPWHLQHGNGFVPATGYTILDPNPAYTGPVKPRIAQFRMVPFTTDTAEFDALISGQLDYGYVPIQDLSQVHSLAARGYRLEPWTDWGFTYAAYNYTNPTLGPLFDQLYFRQALQHLVDQPAYIHAIWKGYAYPTNGPVPVRPATPFASAYEKDARYPYSVPAARRLLASHGWRLSSSGPDTCIRPGSGPSQCGAGIRGGMRLVIPLQYSNGSVVAKEEIEALQSSAALAGVRLELTGSPIATVFGTFAPCNRKTGTNCAWAIKFFSLGPYTWTYSPAYYPTGEELFATNSAFNGGGYSNPTTDRLIAASQTGVGLGSLYAYEDWIAKEVPALWFPSSYNQFSEISTRLHGTLPQDPNLNIYPEAWSLSG